MNNQGCCLYVVSIIKDEPHLALSCGHANLNYHIYNYFLQLENIEDTKAKFNDDIQGTNIIVGYEQLPKPKGNKNIKLYISRIIDST